MDSPNIKERFVEGPRVGDLSGNDSKETWGSFWRCKNGLAR